MPSVRIDFDCDWTKDVAAKRKHTHRQTDRQFELYILDVTYFCDDIQTVVCDMGGFACACYGMKCAFNIIVVMQLCLSPLFELLK